MLARLLSRLLEPLCQGRPFQHVQTRLNAEELEGRWTPAVFRWDRSLLPWTLNTWSEYRNWEKEVAPATWQTPASGEFPGSGGRTGDTARFTNTSSDDCWVDVPVTLNSLTVDEYYYGSITADADITITNQGLLWLKSAGATLGGTATTHGEIAIQNNSSFRWETGVLGGIHATIDSSSSMTIPSHGGGWLATSTPHLVMAATLIEVGGTLNWDWRNIAVNASGPGVPRSEIRVLESGTFNIRAAGQTWGTSTENLHVVKYGSVHLNAGGIATIVGDYTTFALTDLHLGVLTIVGAAEQARDATRTSGEPLFNLKNYTTIVAAGPEHILGIRDGGIIGYGSVDGNL